MKGADDFAACCAIATVRPERHSYSLKRGDGWRNIMRRLGLAACAMLPMLAPLSDARAGDPAGTVRVDMSHGVSLAIPKGWIACDPAVDAELGGLAAQNHADDLCKPSGNDQVRIIVADPDISALAVVATVYDRSVKFPDPSSIASSETLKATLCQMALADEKGPSHCEFSAGTMAGRPVLDGTLEMTTGNGMECKAHIVAFERDGGSMMIMGMSFPKLSAGGGAAFNTVLQSLTIQQ